MQGTSGRHLVTGNQDALLMALTDLCVDVRQRSAAHIASHGLGSYQGDGFVLIHHPENNSVTLRLPDEPELFREDGVVFADCPFTAGDALKLVRRCVVTVPELA